MLSCTDVSQITISPIARFHSNEYNGTCMTLTLKVLVWVALFICLNLYIGKGIKVITKSSGRDITKMYAVDLCMSLVWPLHLYLENKEKKKEDNM